MGTLSGPDDVVGLEEPNTLEGSRLMRVICCRHGQSAANAGAATLDPMSIPLTELGQRQAEEVALQWEQEPSLIAISPAERARATAAPTLKRFPNSPREEWPIHEFTYLSPIRCTGTTGEQRRAWVEAYWAKADATYSDGDGAESFEDFIGRVDVAMRWLSDLQPEGTHPILLFGHGQFINAMRWRLYGNAAPLDMRGYRAFDLENLVQHCSPVELSVIAR